MSNEKGFVITKKWINDNRTAKGGFTKSQLSCLIVSSPPAKGWIKALIGQTITLEQKMTFEDMKVVYSNFSVACPIDKAVKFICQRALKLTPEQKARLLHAIQV